MTFTKVIYLEASERLRSLLQHGEVPSRLIKDLLRKRGYSSATIDRAAKSIGIVSFHKPGINATFWRLPLEDK